MCLLLFVLDFTMLGGRRIEKFFVSKKCGEEIY
jgi:hypothetical protein